MRKDEGRPRLVTFTILTTITILVWIVADLWRVINRPIPEQVDPKILEDINPTLDKQVIDAMKDRVFFSDEEVKTFAPLSETQISTESAIPTVTE